MQGFTGMLKGFLTVFLALFVPVLALGAEVAGVRVWPAPDHVRVVFDLSGPATHQVFTLKNPNRVVVDIPESSLTTDLAGLRLDSTPIRRIRSGVRDKTTLRVVLDLEDARKPRSFLLPPNPPYGNRLVVDLYGKSGKTASRATRKAADKERGRRDILVAIDPGHGGEDPGALGPGGVREKDVVLAIAKRLAGRLRAERGYKPVLIRSGDYYIGLRKRTALARRKQADLFVSIHADAFKSPKAHGTSVYILSPRGATSETASWLAERENRADLIGGVGGVSLGDKDDLLAGVLLDLSMTASLSASEGVGGEVLKSLGAVNRLHKRRVEKAGFVVLKSPDVPSILVETGFISNPAEAARLRTPAYQERIAEALFNGVRAYFERVPPPGTLVAWLRDQKGDRRYVIERGDTLSEIAARHGVSVSTLRKRNQLKNDRIRVGQVLTIPSS